MRWLRRILIVLVAVAMVGLTIVLATPVFRQLAFGPKYFGVPQIIWQDDFRNQHDPDLKKRPVSWFKKLANSFLPKQTRLPWEELEPEDLMEIAVPLLSDGNANVRATCFQVLAGLRRVHRSLIEPLRRAVETGAVILPKIEEIRFLHDDSNKARELIAECLCDPDESVRKEALKEFGQNGDRAKNDSRMSTVEVNRFFARFDALLPSEKVAVLETATAWAGSAPGAVERLVPLTLEEDPELRAKALAALAECMELPPELANDLLAILEKDELRFARPAGNALAKFRYLPDGAWPRLLRLLGHKDEAIRERAIYPACMLSANIAALPPDLTARAADTSLQVRVQLAKYANVVSFDEKGVGEIYRKLLDDESTSVRYTSLMHCAMHAYVLPGGTVVMNSRYERAKDLLHEIAACLGREDKNGARPVFEAIHKSLRGSGFRFNSMPAESNEPARVQAIVLLDEAGRAAKPVLPILLRHLADSDPNFQAAVLKILGRFPDVVTKHAGEFERLLEAPDSRVRITAAKAFVVAGRSKDPKIRATILKCATAPGPIVLGFEDCLQSCIERIKPLTKAEIEEVKQTPFHASTPHGAAVFQELRNQVGNEDWFPEFWVRLCAEGRAPIPTPWRSLMTPGEPSELPEPVLRLLADRLVGAPGEHKLTALWLITAVRTRTEQDYAFVHQMMNDPEPWIVHRAVGALGAFGERAADKVPMLIERLASPKPSERDAALNALGRMKSVAAPALPAIRKLTHSRYASARTAAARTIGEIGESALAALPDLIRLLDDENEGVSEAAGVALGKFGSKAAPAIPKLLTIFRSPANGRWLGAYEALLASDNASNKVIPELIHLLDDPARASNAADVLGEYKERSRGARSRLWEIAEDKGHPARTDALKALLRIGPVDEVVPRQVEMLKNTQSDEHALEFCVSWQELGPAVKAAVPVLVQRLRQQPPVRWRIHGIWVLGAIGPDAAEALPTLQAILDDAYDDDALYFATRDAIAKIQRK